MTVEGADTATRHTPEQLTALHDQHGIRFMARYIAGGGDWKHLTPGERDDLADARINIISIFQGAGTGVDSFDGTARRDAIRTVDAARTLGQPEGSAIYTAVDYDARGDDLETIGQYLREYRDRLAADGFHAGVYGSHRVVEAAKQWVAFRWQTYAWSGGQVSPAAQFLQYQNGLSLAGPKIDRCKAFGEPGWWLPGGAISHSFVDVAEPEDPHDIEQLQTSLDRLGMRPGLIDGVLGPSTRLAVARFQLGFAFQRITVDGLPGKQTSDALNIALGADPSKDRLSPHFYVSELRSRTRPGTPKDNDCFVHRELLENLEALRTAAGKPIKIISGYRSVLHNSLVAGAASRSQHCYGSAPELARLDNIRRDHLHAGRAADFSATLRIDRSWLIGQRLFTGIGHRNNRVTHADVRTNRSTSSPSQWNYLK